MEQDSLQRKCNLPLTEETFIKSKGYKGQRVNKKLEAPQETNAASLGNKSTRPRLDPKKIKRIRNDVSFNYSQTDFKFEEQD